MSVTNINACIQCNAFRLTPLNIKIASLDVLAMKKPCNINYMYNLQYPLLRTRTCKFQLNKERQILHRLLL